MAHDIRLTIRELGESIHRQHGGKIVPDWKLRRVVDLLEHSDSLSVQRIGTYRTISADHVGIVANELSRIGWLVPAAPVDAQSLAAREAVGMVPTPAAG